MADVTITVRGSAQRTAPPERATVHLAVESEGQDRESVLAAVSSGAETIRAQLSQLHEEGGVLAEWAGDQLRTWSERLWDKGGKRPAVHHARAEFRAVFTDFARLGRWVGDAAQRDGVVISHLDWALGDERRNELTEQVRAAAVADAVAKAASYARNLGLGAPHPEAIADLGMLDRAEPGPMVLASRAMSRESAAGGMEFAPEQLTVSVSVDARFVAGDVPG